MITDGFRVVDLDGHIREVDEQVVEPLRRASEAGRPLDLLAYGIVGQVFAARAAEAVALGAAAVAGLTDEAHGFVAGLRTTQASYDRAELDVRAMLELPG